MKINLLNNFSGQMLIEVVIAIGIIALVLVGVSDLMTRSLRVVTFQKQRDEANAYLQKMQNDLKAQRDADPEGFFLRHAFFADFRDPHECAGLDLSGLQPPG